MELRARDQYGRQRGRLCRRVKAAAAAAGALADQSPGVAPRRAAATAHYSIPIRAKKVSIRFDSIFATESIFFDSIRFGNLINLPLVH